MSIEEGETMTNRDFDADNAEVLAEFAGAEYHEWVQDGKPPVQQKVLDFGEVGGEGRACRPEKFKPWLLDSPQWFRQALLDAVREKGLENKFMDELAWELGYGEDEFHTIDLVSAPPEAICSTILSLEGEHQ